MAKTEEKNRAICLREKGESIKDIAQQLNISRSTTSLWCRDVILKAEQIEKLHQKMIKGGYKGRIKGARIQYERRIEKIKKQEERGVRKIGTLSKRDLLIAGLALYWGEGSKKNRSVSLSNSDPEIIKFFVKFLKKEFNIKRDQLTAYIGVNKVHKKRLKEIENYWVKITGISKGQFTKTTLIEAKNKKRYKNFLDHYGTVTVKVKKSADLYYCIMGLIKALK